MKPQGERNRLSQREDEVLKLAASGLTDQQIANVLNIRVSTVTTYWVRIRGKVGQLSRAELIALSVRQRSQEAMNELKQENARLKTELTERQTAETEALRSAGILRACLDLIPAGMLIVRPDGDVAVSNKTAEKMLGCDGKRLEGTCVEELLPQVLSSSGSSKSGGSAVMDRPATQFAVRTDGSVLPARIEVRALDSTASGWIAILLQPSQAQ